MKKEESRMKMRPMMKRALLALVSSFFILHSALAEITATVYPGYQFSANERPTTANLNLLGRPTIYISGTLGGTNVALAANSVTTTMMSDTLPGSNLVWDASSPRKLVVMNAGVDTNQLSSGVAGLGLSGGSGSQLRVNVDTNTVQITNDVITLNLTTFSNLVAIISTNIANYFTTNYASTNIYQSSETAIAAGKLIDAAHSLGGTPRKVWGVAKCITADSSGYSVGDEVELSQIENDDGGGYANFSVGGNSTNVFLTCDTITGKINNKTNGNWGATWTGSNWKVILRATP